MMKTMTKNDINRWGRLHRQRNDHLTGNAMINVTIDRASAIDGILTFKYVNHDSNATVDACQMIKQMTIMLDYHWEYSQYC